MKRYLAAICLLILSTHPAYAGGGGGVGGATEWTQLANNSELVAIYGESVKQVSNQIEQIRNQLKQYEEMLKQGMTLPDSVWIDAVAQLQELENLARSSKGLYSDYGNMERVVKNILDRSQKTTQTAPEAREERIATAEANAEATAAVIDKAVKEQKESLQAITQVQGRSASAVGKMQAIQAGNELAAIAAQELVKLRTDVNNISQYLIASRTNEIDEEKEAHDWIKDQMSRPGPGPSTFKDD